GGEEGSLTHYRNLMNVTGGLAAGAQTDVTQPLLWASVARTPQFQANAALGGQAHYTSFGRFYGTSDNGELREFNANLLVDFSSGRVDAGRLQLCFSGAGCFADSDSWWVEFDEAGDMTLHVDGESRNGGGSLYAILTGNQGQAVAGGFNLCALNGTQCLDSADGLFLLERENRYTYEE